MPSANQYVALGPINVGFLTHGANISIGASIEGKDAGLVAGCDKSNAISAKSTDAAAVIGHSINQDAVVGESDSLSGVFGRTGGKRSAGVTGDGTQGEQSDGVVGQASEGGYGGRFSVNHQKQAKGAQLQLVPSQAELRTGQAQSITPTQYVEKEINGLPPDGNVGDLLLLQNQDQEISLWLCVTPQRGAQTATWRQVLLGSPAAGRALMMKRKFPFKKTKKSKGK